MIRQAGFTLLETLIAMVLVTLLLVALFGGFRAGMTTWRLVETKVAEGEAQLQLTRMLYRHMRQLHTSAGQGFFLDDRVGKPNFMAYPDRIRYVAPLGLSTGSKLYAIELASEPEGRSGLWIRYAPFNRGDDLQALLGEAVFEQVSSDVTAGFEYFYEGVWLDHLRDGETPRLLRAHWRSSQRIWSSQVYAVGLY